MVTSKQFYSVHNPSPGYPHLHHEGRNFFVNPVAADGYEFSHWQISRRIAKGNVSTSTATTPKDMMVSVFYEGKAIPVFLVAFFDRKIAGQVENQPTTIAETVTVPASIPTSAIQAAAASTSVPTDKEAVIKKIDALMTMAADIRRTIVTSW